MSPAPSFDPRTVTREALLERAGVSRPAATVTLVTDEPEPGWVSEVAACREEGGPQLQIIAAVKRAAADAPALASPAKLVTHEPDDTFCAFVNRAASNAIGRIVILVFGRVSKVGEALEALIGKVDADPTRGAATHELAFGAGPWGVSGAIAVRGEIWAALRGFEEVYATPSWALRDMVLRMRAIGFSAPELPCEPRVTAATDDAESDVRFFRQRAAVAPDRSGRVPADREADADAITVYTGITDCYDVLKPQPRRVAAEADLVAFLDEETEAAHGSATRGWRALRHEPVTGDPQRASRFYKVNAHLAFPDRSVTLWVDASISMVFPFPTARLVALFLSDADICVFRHHARQSIYEEAEACKLAGRDSPEVIDAQMARYRAEGLPEDTGLAELPVILRRNTPATRALNEAWWAEIMAGSRRDQLSFNYVTWKLGIPYATFPMSMFAGNGLFIKFSR